MLEAYVQVAAFAAALWDADDVVELRALAGGRVAHDWVQAKELQRESGAIAWIKRHRDNQFNIYAGINPRKSSGGKDAASVAIARCLFADFDGPSFSQAMTIIKDAGLPDPTIGVESGHGAHAYWRLVEGMTDLGLWTRYQKRLIAMLGSDGKIHDAPRIMRVPGTTNWKDDPPVECRVVYESGSRFTLADIGIEPVPENDALYLTPGEAMDPGDGWAELVKKSTLAFVATGARVGDRNGALFAAACDLCGAGVPIEKAFTLLIGPSQRSSTVDKPFHDWEIERTIRSAYGKPRSMATGAGGGGFKDVWVAKIGNAPEVAPKQADGVAEVPVVAPSQPPKARRSTIANVATRTVKDGDGEVKTQLVYKPIDQFAAELGELTGNWPRSASGMLFAPREVRDRDPLPGMKSVWMFPKSEALSSWFHDVADVHWVDSRGSVVDAATGTSRSPFNKAEFFEWMRSRAFVEYRGIAALPHCPPLEGMYYCPVTLPPATGTALRAFLDAMNPESDIDRVLLLAAIVTPGWGGEPGTRPALAFTANYRGAGKTATAEAICQVWGSNRIKVEPNESFSDLLRRLLDDASMGSRCVLFDNVKGKQDCASLDSILTTRTIDGKKMYVGQQFRNNDLTYYITANYPRLGEDMAKRAIIMRIGKPKFGQDFIGWSTEFIREHRTQILADIYALLGMPITRPYTGHLDRWGAWSTQVLARCAEWLNGDMEAVGKAIVERQIEANDDADRAESVAEAIERWLKDKARSPIDGRPSRITREEMHELLLLHKVIDGGHNGLTTDAANTMVKNLSSLPPLEGRLVWLTKRVRVAGNVRQCWEWHAEKQDEPNDKLGNDSPDIGGGGIDGATGEQIPF